MDEYRLIGLASSILVNAFWPALAVAVAWLVGRRHASRKLFPAVIVATALLLAGSVSHVLVLSR